MAITPVTLTRTWYSLGNVPFTPTTADDTQKWFLWLLKSFLIGDYASAPLSSGTVGPEGARPASSYWTVVGSNDGVGNFSSGGPVGNTNNDGVDRWVSRANVIFANAGTNHSWIILKSPVATNPNGALGFGQGPMWMLLDNSGDAGTAVLGRAKIMFSREPFTGGTATARPTSPKEFDGAMYAAGIFAPTIWTDTNYNVLRRASFSVDANGQWFFVTARSGSLTVESVNCLVENINSDDRDLYKQHASLCYFGIPQALVSRVWSGSTQRVACLTSSGATLVTSTSGGLVQWGFGRATGPIATHNAVNGLNNTQYTGAPAQASFWIAGENPAFFGTAQGLDIDGYTIALPMYVLDYGAGYLTSAGTSLLNNNPQWRGQLPDCWCIGSLAGTLAIGSSYPNSVNQTHVVVATPTFTPTVNGCSLIPMSVQLAI
jgi:hypothetical protein